MHKKPLQWIQCIIKITYLEERERERERERHTHTTMNNKLIKKCPKIILKYFLLLISIKNSKEQNNTYFEDRKRIVEIEKVLQSDVITVNYTS